MRRRGSDNGLQKQKEDRGETPGCFFFCGVGEDGGCPPEDREKQLFCGQTGEGAQIGKGGFRENTDLDTARMEEERAGRVWVPRKMLPPTRYVSLFTKAARPEHPPNSHAVDQDSGHSRDEIFFARECRHVELNSQSRVLSPDPKKKKKKTQSFPPKNPLCKPNK
jgi:hypothetical protein